MQNWNKLFQTKKKKKFRRGRQLKAYAKPEAAITVFELLIMGGLSPETC